MSDEKHQDALRTIGEVAADIGVATHVLRFWESKFSQIKPQKRRGRRYYGAAEVAIIRTIKELLYEQGYTIKGVHKYLIAAKKQQALARNNIQAEPENAELPNLDLFEDSQEDNDNSGIQNLDAGQLDKLTEIYYNLRASRNKLKELG